jgi:hypothetical protein
MIVSCAPCGAAYDDEYRWTWCPHDTFVANDGENRFAHHPESYRRSPVEHVRFTHDREVYRITLRRRGWWGRLLRMPAAWRGHYGILRRRPAMVGRWSVAVVATRLTWLLVTPTGRRGPR